MKVAPRAFVAEAAEPYEAYSAACMHASLPCQNTLLRPLAHSNDGPSPALSPQAVSMLMGRWLQTSRLFGAQATSAPAAVKHGLRTHMQLTG